MIQFFPSRAVALQLFGLNIHWYGILYVASFLIAAFLLPLLQRFRGMHEPKERWFDVVTWAVLGVLVGGRLGFVFFYEPSYFLRMPWKVIAVWEGGMASHGGFVGVIAAVWLYTRMKGMRTFAVADLLSIPAALGLGLGRIGNFINQELYGTVTSLPWAIRIPGVEGLRHPLQIYDALLMVCIALLCFVLLRLGKPERDGRIFAVFILSYGVTRFLLEYIRVQTYEPFTLWFITLTRGQLLTVPLIFFGIVLWWVGKPAQKDA
ncbi:MAG: prolipoprotein diacylglyceryl transferase [Candidatus Peribacteraceae bacterium]|jgi:phosphatidylglycerol:prolipoprotein diacylglycerol transferase